MHLPTNAVCLSIFLSVLSGCAGRVVPVRPDPSDGSHGGSLVSRDSSGRGEADPIRATWYAPPARGGVQPEAYWSARSRIRALEPSPLIGDVLTTELRRAASDLPDGFYSGAVADGTDRYLEIKTVRDQMGRTLFDAADGDGTLPRLDAMLSRAFRHDRSIGQTRGEMNLGVRPPDEDSTSATIVGNVVIPRFTGRRVILLPLQTLREADRGTLAFGRGRSISIGTAVERTRGTRSQESQEFEVEEVNIGIDLTVQAFTDFPLELTLVMADGSTKPAPEWTRGTGIGVRGWSVTMRPSDVAGDGVVEALRLVVAKGIEFERRPFTIEDVPIQYTPRPEP